MDIKQRLNELIDELLRDEPIEKDSRIEKMNISELMDLLCDSDEDGKDREDEIIDEQKRDKKQNPEMEALMQQLERRRGESTKSARYFVEWVEAAQEDERYLELVAQIVKDNGTRHLGMTENRLGYIQLQHLKPVEGSILGQMDLATPHLHLVLLNYRDKTVYNFSCGRGGITGDHITEDKNKNNPFTELRLLATELNNLRKSEGKTKSDFKVGERFGLPLHKTIFNKSTKRIQHPFTMKRFQRTSEGRKLRDSYGYHPGTSTTGSRKWAYTKKAAHRTFQKIVRCLCAFLIDCIEGEGGDEFCTAMGEGWSHPKARANNVAYLRGRICNP